MEVLSNGSSSLTFITIGLLEADILLTLQSILNSKLLTRFSVQVLIVCPLNCISSSPDYTSSSCSIKIIYRDPNGISDAFNAALPYITGDYVCFLNSGDTLSDSLAQCDSFNTFCSTIHRQPLAAVFMCSSRTFMMPSPRIIFLLRFLSVFQRASLLRLFFTFLRAYSMPHQSTFYSTQCLIGLFYNTRYKVRMDYDFNILFLQKNVFHSSPQLLYQPLHVSDMKPDGVSSYSPLYNSELFEILNSYSSGRIQLKLSSLFAGFLLKRR